MSDAKWCQSVAKQVADGKLSIQDLIGAPDLRWGTELAKWERVCRDPGLRKLRRLESQGRVKAKARQAASDARHKALMKKIAGEAASGKYLSQQQKQDVAKLNQSPSTAWAVIKATCQTSVKMLDKAKSQSGSNPHIQVWNGKLAKTLHNFLGAANKWTEKGKKALAVYNAFVALKSVDPKLAAKNPQAYALQMGNAVKEIGNALKILPPPFDGYGKFLAEAGKFFYNMSSALIPGQRSSSRDYAPGGRFYSPYDRVYTGR